MLVALLALLTASPAQAQEACVTPPNAPFNADKFQLIADEVGSGDDGLKSRAEVDRYMTCFRENSTQNNKYLKQYSAYVERASKAFGIPYSVLACLLFVETKWNKDSKSGVGALGLSQLMPNKTIPHINKMLKHRDNSEKLRKRRENFALAMKHQKIAPGTPEYRAAEANFQAEIDVNAVFVLNNKSWGTYWGNKAKKVKLPLDDQSLLDPETAVGLSAFYLKYILLKFDLKANTPFARMLLAGGAYNVGPGKMMEVYRKAKPRTFENIKSMYAKAGNAETSEHLENIYLCAKKGKWDPTDEKDKRKCE